MSIISPGRTESRFRMVVSEVCVYPLNGDIDAADPIAGPFLDGVNQVHLSRLLQVANFRFYIGEHVADAAVLVHGCTSASIWVLVKGCCRVSFNFSISSAVANF